MGEDKWPEGPTRKRWFERGREYERGRLDEAEEEDKGRSLLEKIAEEERQNIGRNLKRLKGL